MTRTPVTAVFDIGKTNKKFFLLDPSLHEVYREYRNFEEISDDDGFPTEDLPQVEKWMKHVLYQALKHPDYAITGLNFSSYGASLVHIDSTGKPVTPLYNYLKPFPEQLLDHFYQQYGGEKKITTETASPSLGMLNSGLQLYWLKHQKPQYFRQIQHTLHLPQYFAYLFSGKLYCDPTSVGCHTMLWDYKKNQYHPWVMKEGLDRLFPEIVASSQSLHQPLKGTHLKVGVGIHDSSAALVPYLVNTQEPFLLISTGTWSITLNPFTQEHLSFEDLQKDCLYFLDAQSRPVRAARLFLGKELDEQAKKLSQIFHKAADYHHTIKLKDDFIHKIENRAITRVFYPEFIDNTALLQDSPSHQWHPERFRDFEEAYHYLVWGLVELQIKSFHLAKGPSDIKKVYMDGGFIHNDIFFKLLQYKLPDHIIIPSSFPLGSAYGAALVLEDLNAQSLNLLNR